MVKLYKTLVLGASIKPQRYSYRAVQQLVEGNYPVVAIGQQQETIFGVPIRPPFTPFDHIHTISLYLSPKHQPDYFDYILKIKPKRVLFNPGTENATLAALLQKNNIAFENACTLILLATNQYQT